VPDGFRDVERLGFGCRPMADVTPYSSGVALPAWGDELGGPLVVADSSGCVLSKVLEPSKGTGDRGRVLALGPGLVNL